MAEVIDRRKYGDVLPGLSGEKFEGSFPVYSLNDEIRERLAELGLYTLVFMAEATEDLPEVDEEGRTIVYVLPEGWFQGPFEH